MNKLLTQVCDKYQVSCDVQDKILHYIQRNLFTDGWNHLNRPENVKWVKEAKKHLALSRYNDAQDQKNSGLLDLFLYIYRDKPNKNIVELFTGYQINIYQHLYNIEKKTQEKLVLPFRHQRRYESSSLQRRSDFGIVCDYETSKPKLLAYIDEYTPYSKNAKKSYSKDEIIKVVISGDRRRRPYELRGFDNSHIISPQESSRRYLAKNAK